MKALPNEHLIKLAKDVQDGRQLLQAVFPCPELREWIPRHEIMQYFGFGATQMTAIAKKYGFKVVKIGKRIFYNVKQILEIFNSLAN